MRNDVVSLALDAQGALWRLSREHGPQQLADDLSAGLDRLRRRSASRVAVLAHPCNARLIVRLCQCQRYLSWPQEAWLGPRQARVQEELFIGPFQPTLPASLGGWRRATAVDAITYDMHAMLEVADAGMPLAVGDEAFGHPAWPALSFIDGCDVEQSLRLIAEIEDPRWHVDPLEPDSDELLCARFGLDERHGPRNVAAFLAGDGSRAAARYDQAKLVLDAWYNPQLDATKSDVRQSFLRAYPAGVEDLATRLLMASLRFLDFVTCVWLDNLTPQRLYDTKVSRPGFHPQQNVATPRLRPARSYTRQLFVAEHFFENMTTAKEWHDHLHAWHVRNT